MLGSIQFVKLWIVEQRLMMAACLMKKYVSLWSELNVNIYFYFHTLESNQNGEIEFLLEVQMLVSKAFYFNWLVTAMRTRWNKWHFMLLKTLFAFAVVAIVVVIVDVAGVVVSVVVSLRLASQRCRYSRHWPSKPIYANAPAFSIIVFWVRSDKNYVYEKIERLGSGSRLEFF